MAHHRTVSVGSISSLSSLSSEEAVEAYRDPVLQQSITRTLTSTQPSLEALLARAGGIIKSFVTHEKRVYEYQGKTINLDGILAAMLHHAERAGGECAHCGPQGVGNSDHEGCYDINSDEKRRNVNSYLWW